MVALVVVLLLLVATVASCTNKSNEPKANPYQFTPSAEPVIAVDSATVSKVKTACEDQLRAVATSSKRKLSGIVYKPFDIVSVTFTGEVKQVNLPYKEIAWEVPTTWVSKVADGRPLTSNKTCQFRKLQDDARYLP
ncbi:hypothetical protein GCM10009825_01090 [Arthrobacter humicola]|uniref:Uncharacterized protein n=2 Tax=Arthrobacter humicola TaxID=409291 RepID=A0ABN2YDI8_9MICC